MKLGQEILYLANADIEGCGLSLAQVEQAVETMFAAKADGSARMEPKHALRGDAIFLASSGIMTRPSYAGVKWVGVADNHERGLPHIAGTIVLSDGETGMPVSVMDARWITQVRTAAISAVAARRLARPDSASIGFIACGVQARSHLAAFALHFPLKQVHAYSRRLATAEAFAEEARAQGYEARATHDPRAVLEAADIVVTTTPIAPPPEPFLHAGWLRPGSFAAMVDLGLPWMPDTLLPLDLMITDDVPQAKTERLTYPEAFHGEIADLVAGKLAGRQSPEQRTALMFAGVGLADVAVAAAVYEQARAAGAGRLLPV